MFLPDTTPSKMKRRNVLFIVFTTLSFGFSGCQLKEDHGVFSLLYNQLHLNSSSLSCGMRNETKDCVSKGVSKHRQLVCLSGNCSLLTLQPQTWATLEKTVMNNPFTAVILLVKHYEKNLGSSKCGNTALF